MAPKKVVWSSNHQRNFDNLYNLLKKNKPELLKDYTKDEFLIKINKKLLKQYILSLDYSLSRKETYLFTVARWYEYNNIDNTFVQEFKQTAYDLKMKRQDIDGENELDSKEIKGYMRYEELIAVRDSIDYNEIKTKREHYKYLLLSLLIETPLRTGYYTSAKFITNQKTEPNVNYMMLLGTNVKKAFYYIQ